MKFCKRYAAYVRGLQPGSSCVEFKRLKKLLKKCPQRLGAGRCAGDCEIAESQRRAQASGSARESCASRCSCECDLAFFPLLKSEVVAVSGCFNYRAQQLFRLHLASGFRKYLLRLRYKHYGNQWAMIEEGKELVSYMSMNVLAIRKILKKYDKIHYSKKGRAFKTWLQAAHLELLQSPWLIELIAFQFNLKNSNASLPEFCAECSYDFEGSKPTISCTLTDSVKLETDLTCSICLEMVFDPVCLRCGHIFCYVCACSAASTPIVLGLKAADKNAKCPLCRQTRVCADAVHLTELASLISTRCKDYWDERLQREKAERIQQIKEYWDNQCRAVLGI